MDPLLTQAKLSLEANHDQYSCDFDATIEYSMNQVTHQQVNQQLNIASVGSNMAWKLKNHDKHGHKLKMPLINYLPKESAQLPLPRGAIFASARLKQMVVAGMASSGTASSSRSISSGKATGRTMNSRPLLPQRLLFPRALM